MLKVFIEENDDVKPTSSSELPCFIKFSLCGHFIIAFYSPNKQGKKYLNLFSKEISEVGFSVKLSDGTHFPIPPYIMFDVDILANSINMNYEVIYEAVKKFTTENDYLQVSSNLINFSLECIKAYDICYHKKLLEIATKVLLALKEKDFDKAVIYINLFQIEKRLNTDLSRRSYEILLSINDQSDATEITLRFCVYVLLGQKNVADLYLEKIKLEENEGPSIEEMPIL